MPSRDWHLSRAEHNERIYLHLSQSQVPCSDWQITALFYAALHYVDAYLADRITMRS